MTNFKVRCEEVANELGIDVEFYPDNGGADRFEDDGYLHIRRGGLRACFDVSNGQQLSAYSQNNLTRRVLTGLGYRSVGERVLV